MSAWVPNKAMAAQTQGFQFPSNILAVPQLNFLELQSLDIFGVQSRRERGLHV